VDVAVFRHSEKAIVVTEPKSAEGAVTHLGGQMMPKEKTSNENDDPFGKLALVPCRVEPGMFRGEWLAFIEARDPAAPGTAAKAQLLVDQREITDIQGTPKRNNPVNAWLRVSLVRGNADWMQVVLPQPCQPFGESVLVSRAEVREEPAL
jgi:hypothetical protein